MQRSTASCLGAQDGSLEADPERRSVTVRIDRQAHCRQLTRVHRTSDRRPPHSSVRGWFRCGCGVATAEAPSLLGSRPSILAGRQSKRRKGRRRRCWWASPRRRPSAMLLGRAFPAPAGISYRAPHPVDYFLHDPGCFFPHFTFPVAKHIPPCHLQPSVVSSVASLILPQLLVPEGGVVHRRGVVIGTPVPETSVDEDRDFCPNEVEIGPGSGDPTPQPVSQTCAP